MGTIQEGDYAIFDENGDKKSIHQIRTNGFAKVGKFHIPLGQLVGAPWGATYRLAADGSHLTPVTHHEPMGGPVVERVGCDGDNRSLVDRNQQNQSLTARDIEDMITSGKHGEDIIAALCQASSTFEGKTEFAQDKYKKKKARKYNALLTLLQPNSWLICQVTFDKTPSSVWNMRPDSLGLLLCQANVAAHSRTLLLENCQGLLAAACAERQGGHGLLCCVGTGGKQAPLTGLRLLNLDQQHKDIVCTAQLGALLAAHQRYCATEESKQQHAAGADIAAGSSKQQQQQQQQDLLPGLAATEKGDSHAALSAHTSSSPAQVPAVAAMEVDLPPQQQQQQQHNGPAAAAGANINTLGSGPDQHEDPAHAADPDGGHPHKKQRRDEAAESEQQQQQQQQQLTAPQAVAAAAAAQRWQQQEDMAHDELAAAGQPNGAATADEGEADIVEADAGGAAAAAAKRFAASAQQLDTIMVEGGFNSCIIAAPRLHTLTVLQEVLPLLAPSTPFVVFSPWLQPLAEAMQLLASTRQAVLLQLQETWLRPYQVLPGRTHPHMNMTTGGTGGYVLSGTTVARPIGSEPGEGGGADSKEGDTRGGGRAKGGKRGFKGGRGKRR